MWCGRISTMKYPDFMNSIILYLLQTELGRRIELQILLNLVASSLGLPKERVLTTRSANALDLFARYTATHLPGCSKAQLMRLNESAFRLGTILRCCLTDRSAQALMKVVVVLYRNIGIEMQGAFPDEVSVVRCHFCAYYTPHTCTAASSIDAGVICGLYAAPDLRFTQRITEGKDKCCCHLVAPKE